MNADEFSKLFGEYFTEHDSVFGRRGRHPGVAGRYMDEEELKRRVAACGLDYNTTRAWGIAGNLNLVLVPAYAEKRMKCSLNFSKIEDIEYEQEYNFRV